MSTRELIAAWEPIQMEFTLLIIQSETWVTKTHHLERRILMRHPAAGSSPAHRRHRRQFHCGVRRRDLVLPVAVASRREERTRIQTGNLRAEKDEKELLIKQELSILFFSAEIVLS